MADTIVYTTISKGGNVTGAYLEKNKALENLNAPWNKIQPIVVDLEELAKKTLANFDPVTRLALENHYEINVKTTRKCGFGR